MDGEIYAKIEFNSFRVRYEEYVRSPSMSKMVDESGDFINLNIRFIR